MISWAMDTGTCTCGWLLDMDGGARSPRILQRSKTTARGFEPLRAEPNGFLVHHLGHSVTVSMEFHAGPWTSHSGAQPLRTTTEPSSSPTPTPGVKRTAAGTQLARIRRFARFVHTMLEVSALKVCQPFGMRIAVTNFEIANGHHSSSSL